MPKITRSITVTICCTLIFMNTACTTIKPIDVDEQSTYAQKIEAGDKVRLIYLDGRVNEIRVIEINDLEITGKLESGAVVFAGWHDIYEVERVAISPIKTAGAAVGIVVAIPVLALLAVMSGCVTTYC